MVYQYYHVKNVYEDDEYYYPKALINKERRKFNYHDSSKISQIYGYINGFIRSHLNEKFDDVFHKFCHNKKFPINTCVYDRSLRTVFLDLICSNKKLLNMHHHYEKYYIDDEGYIRETRPNKNIPRMVRIQSSEKRKFCENNFNKNVCSSYRNNEITNILKKFLDPIQFEEIQTLPYISIPLCNRVRNLIIKKCYISEWELNRLFENPEHPVYKEVSIHSKECKRYFAEGAWLKPLKRIRKKQLEIKHVNLIKEIEEQRKKEELELNTITRDRLGFDDNSFKGEFYHGQKRKKKS